METGVASWKANAEIQRKSHFSLLAAPSNAAADLHTRGDVLYSSHMPNPTPIDLTHLPDLVRIAEEVEATKTPRELRGENKLVAVIMPAKKAPTKKKRVKTKADYEAFKSAAGGWKDLVDREKLKRDISESRKISTRPPIKL
jgi:hypothetical protein